MSGRGQKVHKGAAPRQSKRSSSNAKRSGKRGPRIDAATLAHLDEDEARLEALVFGGGAGTSLGGGVRDSGSSARASASHGGTGAGLVAAPKAPRAAAWDDEDDAGIAVDIASTARLRKLRTTEGEVAIAGDEYSRRLRERHAALVAGSGAAVSAAGSSGAAAPGSWATLPATKRKRPASSAPGAAGYGRAGRGVDDSDDGAATGGAGAATAAALGRVGGRRRLDSDDGDEHDGFGAAGSDAAEDEHEDEDEDDEEALLRSAGGVVASAGADGGSSGPLPAGHLSISRVRDANRAEPSKAVVQAAAFHHSAGAVLLTGGLDRKLRFFAIDGKRNPKVASVMFPDLPIASAGWSHDGNEVFVSGRRPFFYSYDVAGGAATRVPRLLGRDEKSLESMVVQTPTSCMTAATTGGAAAAYDVPMLAFLGNDGTVIMASQHTKTLVTTLRLNGSVRAAAFVKPWLSPAGSHTGWSDLLTIGSEGAVYRWDLRTMRCLYRHADEGSTGGTAIAGSEDGRFVAVGSSAGIVNVYDSSAHDIAKLYSLGTGTGAGAASGGAGASAGAGAVASSVDSLAGAGVFSAESLGGRAPRPLFSSMSLTTSISRLAFSPGAGEMLSIASQRTTDAFRLVHSASGKPFPNWPSSNTPLHYVTASSFSPHCGYIAVGNDRGRVLLYRLNHYAEA